MARLTLLLAALMLIGCSRHPDPWAEAPPEKLRVLASFPPIYCFAAHVAEPDGYVLAMLTGQGPHSYKPNHRDADRAKKASVFFYNGQTLDDGIVEELVILSRSPAKKFDLSRGVAKKDLIAVAPDHVCLDGCKHGDHDPHLWLGPTRAKEMVDQLARDLAEVDPAHAEGYRQRAGEYKQKLDELLAYGRAKLAGKSAKVITMHEALGYFARDFGVEIVGSIQKIPGQDSDQKGFGDLFTLCQEKGVRVILVEPQYSLSQAEQLQNELRKREIVVKIAEFDTFETAAADKNGRMDKNLYLETMRKNIDRLAEALP